MIGTFIEAKGVYRVENEDGSFDTYTPTDYRAKFGETISTEKVVVSDEDETKDEVEVDESEVGLYKLLVAIPYTDEAGTVIGESEIGSIQEVPMSLGDQWVEDGKAIKGIKSEGNTQN